MPYAAPCDLSSIEKSNKQLIYVTKNSLMIIPPFFLSRFTTSFHIQMNRVHIFRL